MAAIKDGRIVIDCEDLQAMFKSAPEEEKVELARFLCMEKVLFEGACDAMANGYWGDMWEGGWSFNHATVNEFRQKLIPLMPAIMKDLVYGLLRERKSIQARHDYYQKLAWWYEHDGYPDSYGERREKPVDPGFGVDAPADEEIDDFINRVLQIGAAEVPA